MPNIYVRLSKIKFLKANYSLKFLFVAFLGIHIPLIIIVLISLSSISTFSKQSILLITLAATLVSSSLTLYFLKKLLWPLLEAKKALENYVTEKKLPALPVHFEDEAGILLRELQSTLEHLDYLIDEKKDITTLLSHDIRTPFNQFLALSALIILETNKTLINEHAKTIKEVSVKNLSVLNDILKLLKTDKQDSAIDSLVSLAEMIGTACNNLATTANDKSIGFELELTSDIRVIANQTLLIEAIANLLNNAIKFSYPEGKIHISLTKKEGVAIMQIKDHGIGIDETDKSKIFNRFTSFGRAGTQGEYSTGVGLYLTKNIILKHKGHISVDSEGKNKGTTFTVVLPVG